MAGKVDISLYRAVLAVREAWRFDIGTAFMRMFQFSVVVGSISMLTLAGYSAFWSGTVASLGALAMFILSPRVAKAMDRRGQNAVAPFAVGAVLAGLVVELVAVSLEAPVWVCYIGAVLTGFLPSGPSLARTRWTYLIESGKLGARAPEMKTVYSYEGIIEDVAFMVAPALVVALNTLVAPIAGMAMVGCLLAVGTFLLVSSKGTEPEDDFLTDQPAEDGGRRHLRNMFLESGAVRMIFLSFLFMGLFFGVLDMVAITFTEALGHPTAASWALTGSAVLSATGGFVYGMVHVKAPIYRQFVLFGALLGIGSAFMVFVDSIPALYAVYWIPNAVYAPFLISANALCQERVPKERLTESLTWVNMGTVCGLAIGPTLSGHFVDAIGWSAGFAVGSVAAAALAVAVLLSLLLWRRAA